MWRFLALLPMLAPQAAQAGDITIGLPESEHVEQTTVQYDCGGFDLSVDYINAGANSLAVLHMKEGAVIAANVLSASGARYAGRQFVWWTKGSQATLYDLMQGEDSAAASCRERG